jgi:Protein of unknown function with HXXEE motif
VRHRIERVFLFLIVSQAAHSCEEYFARLYDVFGPARFVASLISSDLARGFLIANMVLVLFGLWCWAVPVRRGWQLAPGFIWFWTILEIGNGAGHSVLAWSRGGYFPGVATAPLLLLCSIWLAVLLLRASPVTVPN